MKYSMLFIIIFAITLIADRLTKIWALSNLKGPGTIEVIPGFLNWTYVENRGAAFGFMEGKQGLFFLIALVVSAYIFYFAHKNYPKLTNLTKTCLALISSGAIGNALDRLLYGYVVDFISVGFRGSFKFAVFNVADICVTLGCFLLIILLLRGDIDD